ncbi:hypothetical protein VTO42DRAFT_6140 [Malbranchea cinnamomea]
MNGNFARSPVNPLRLFSPPSTLIIYVVFTFNFYVFMGIVYYRPLYSQSVLGVDALDSGLRLLPLIISCALAAAISGVFIQRTGKYVPAMHVGHALLTPGAGLFINLKFEKSLTKMFIYEIVMGYTAAVIATMNFVRTLGTAASAVVVGVISQNEMNSANPGLARELGPQLASRSAGDNASANVEFIRTLPEEQQDIARRTYFEALRPVWIMFVAFADLSTMLNMFVRGHHLSTEKKEVVLGMDSRKTDVSPSSTSNNALGLEGVELVRAQGNSS